MPPVLEELGRRRSLKQPPMLCHAFILMPESSNLSSTWGDNHKDDMNPHKAEPLYQGVLDQLNNMVMVLGFQRRGRDSNPRGRTPTGSQGQPLRPLGHPGFHLLYYSYGSLNRSHRSQDEVKVDKLEKPPYRYVKYFSRIVYYEAGGGTADDI